MNGFRNISTSWSDGAEDLASGPRGLSPPLAELGVQGLRCQPRSVCGASWTQAGSPVWQALQAPRGSDSPGGGLDRGQGGCVQRGPTTTQDGRREHGPARPSQSRPAGPMWPDLSLGPPLGLRPRSPMGSGDPSCTPLPPGAHALGCRSLSVPPTPLLQGPRWPCPTRCVWGWTPRHRPQGLGWYLPQWRPW